MTTWFIVFRSFGSPAARCNTKRHRTINGKTGLLSAQSKRLFHFRSLGPRRTGHRGDQPVEDDNERAPDRIVCQFGRFFRSEQRPDVGHESRRGKLRKHPLLGLSPADGRSATIEIESEAFDHARRIQVVEGFKGVK